jgi:hypothetical protein
MNDPVKNPNHYTSHPSGVECIDITKHMNFCCGNVVKYIWRHGLKDAEISGKALEDLKKARQYLDFEIERVTAIQKSSMRSVLDKDFASKVGSNFD